MIKRSTLENLLEEQHKDAFFWSKQCCRLKPDEAEDVLQMAYLKVLDGKAKYSEKSSFKTWLFAIIRFTAIDHLKGNAVFSSFDDLENEVAEESTYQEKNYEQLLAQLPARQSEVLLLAFYHGMTLEEIAKTTGLHIGTVRTHYARGKAGLKKLLLKEEV
mgnify:CR=1 FL=1